MYRQFTDDRGAIWEAWEVRPSSVERRTNDERRTAPRAGMDRRRRHEVRPMVPPSMERGWLAFHGAFRGSIDRLRLVPIPDGWMNLSEAELAALLRRAERVTSVEVR